MLHSPLPRFRCIAHNDSCSPQYYEIYKYKEVIGISITFMCIDLMGGVFNDLSLVFKDKFDVVAGITYSLVVVCPTSPHPFVRSDSSSTV